MKAPGTGWLITIALLFLATFGFWTCFKLVIMGICFIMGIITAFYVFIEESKPRLTMADLLANPLEQINSPRTLSKIPLIKDEEDDFLPSFAITGHEEVDRFLNEILVTATDEYITPWYSIISSNRDFLKAIKILATSFAVELSNRMKSVDWLGHITGKVIEDMACHLRLFRGAGGSASSNSRQPRRGSPAHSPARSSPHHRRNKSDTDVASFSGLQSYNVNNKTTFKTSNTSLERKFFEIELEVQKKKFSRENVSMDDKRKSLLISELSQMLLLLTQNNCELKCRTTLCMLRIIVSIILESAIDFAVTPDTLNTFLLRLSSKDSLSCESFLSVLRSTDNIEEIKATLALVQKEIHNLVSQDSGGECEIGVKQQLSSLQYLTRILSSRSSILAPAVTSITTPMVYTKLPLEFLLENHLAICYFLDFAQGMSAHLYILCYLSIEAWHAAAVKQLSETDMSDKDNTAMTTIKAAAFTIFEQYFSKDATFYLDIPPHVLETFRSKKDLPWSSACIYWFNDIKNHIYTKLESVENAFRNSNQYIRLLAELDLEEAPVENPRTVDHRRTGSMGNPIFGPKSNSNDKLASSTLSQEVPCRLEVVIVETGLMQERGKSYGVYSLEVKKWDSLGRQYCWHVYRRYSDFLELNNAIKEAYPELGKMEFPSKKTFHNTSRNVLERRMVALSSWISELVSLGSPGGPVKYAPLHLYLLPFLNPRGPQDKQQATAINSMLVQPLRQGMRTLRNVPEQLVNTVDDIVGGISKLITNSKTNATNDSQSIAAANMTVKGFDVEGNYESEELPLRVLLLFLDEVFELRSRNRWLRRQIVTILRQILTAMFSDVLNKKIIDSVSSFTSPDYIAFCLQNIKRSCFPNSKTAEKNMYSRDLATQARARVAAKTLLLSIRQDELKHLIGSQTTQRGLLTVFELFQNKTLNIRLIFIFIEGILKVIYQDRDLSIAFQKMLHQSNKPQELS